MKAPPQPVFNKTAPPPPVDPDRQRMESQIFALTENLKAMKRENQKLREDQSTKLDAIMAAIQNGAVASTTTSLTGQSYQRASMDPKAQDDRPMVADGAAPTFLPSQIKPDGAEARIDVQGEEAESKVSSAAEQLRKLRKKKS